MPFNSNPDYLEPSLMIYSKGKLKSISFQTAVKRNYSRQIVLPMGV
jgi:hypothetical protein